MRGLTPCAPDYKDSLRLSGPVGDLIEPAGMFADICGDLVVKFETANVKGIVKLGQVELVLVLEIEVDDPEIIASDTIIVKK